MPRAAASALHHVQVLRREEQGGRIHPCAGRYADEVEQRLAGSLPKKPRIVGGGPNWAKLKRARIWVDTQRLVWICKDPRCKRPAASKAGLLAEDRGKVYSKSCQAHVTRYHPWFRW